MTMSSLPYIIADFAVLMVIAAGHTVVSVSKESFGTASAVPCLRSIFTLSAVSFVFAALAVWQELRAFETLAILEEFCIVSAANALGTKIISVITLEAVRMNITKL